MIVEDVFTFGVSFWNKAWIMATQLAAVSDPFSEVRVAWDCIKFIHEEFRDLNKKHLMIGIVFCLLDFVIASIFANISIIHSLHPMITANTQHYPIMTAILYGIVENAMFIGIIWSIQHFVSYSYWSRRYCDNSFRESILCANNEYKINKIDGMLVCYPWLLLPILICHTLLNLIILLSHFHFDSISANSLWTYEFIKTLFLFLSYIALNKVIWRNLHQNKQLFTIQNVIDFYTEQCLQTSKRLLSPHVMFIDGISQIIMAYIGPHPLPQFNFIDANLKKSIRRLDVLYVSRIITLIFSLYSVLKIFSFSFYDQKDASNIFTVIGTMLGVLIFGHMIRRMALNIFFTITHWLHFGNAMSLILLFLVLLIPLLSIYLNDGELSDLDLWIALIFDNALSAQYDFLYSDNMRCCVLWIRFAFAQIGYILMSAAFGWIIRNILMTSYDNARI